ncbi:MAG: DUF3667 domain-containing protein [Pseudomonadota bacterium]
MSEELEGLGAFATAGLAAAAIEGGGQHDGHAHGSCANCMTTLSGAFCHGCGQAAHIHRSLLHLAEEVLHGILHFDAKGWRTIPLLVFRPGRLTRRYIDGQRKTYVSPLALFLFMVFLSFFAASLGSGDKPLEFKPDTPQEHADKIAGLGKAVEESRRQVQKAEEVLVAARAGKGDVADANDELKDAKREFETMSKSLQRAIAPPKDETEVGAPGWIEKLSKKAAEKPILTSRDPELDKKLRHALANPELSLYKLKNTTYKFSFMLIPISLPFVWLMFFWKRDVKMYDHAVFVLYSLCFMSLLFVVLTALSAAGLGAAIPWLVCLAPPLHMFVQLRGTYALGKWGAFWRTMVLQLVALIVISMFIVFVLVMTVR